jgi:lipopolysaccharide biosynthesis regulator YciM
MAMGACDATVKGNLAQCDRVLSSCARISLDVPKQQIVDMTKLAGAEVETAGRKAYQDGEMHMASLYFAELVKRQPANLDGRRLLGHALEGAGDHTQAVAVFEPMSLGGQLAFNDQFCYAHALAASGLYDRSIAIMQRLHEGQPANMTYRLELTKMFSAAGQLDKAIGMCRDSLAMSGTSEDRKNLNNVYESLLTQQLRGKKVGSTAADAASATRADTEG